MRKSKKAAGAFLLSLVLLLGSVPVSVYADEIPVQTETEAVLDTEEKEEELVVDVSDYILQEGGFVQEEETILEQPKFAGPNNGASGENVVSDREGVIEVLCRTAKNWDGTSPSVKVQMGDVVFLKEDVSSIYTQFVNEHPELFFITGRVGFSSRSGMVVSVTMYCNSEKYDLTAVEAFDKSVSSILSKMESSWSDEQKALFLHDYIVTHCEYDLTLSNYSAYDTLVTGSSVCQGYSLAYYYLLKQCGVDVSVISSEDMNHAWNQVVIDGQKYYADCTWDDPTASDSSTYYQDYCAHYNFLRSQDGIIGTGHDSTDWADQTRAAVFDTKTGSKYEDAWWIGTVSAIPCVGNMWAYVPNDASVIYVHDYAAGSNRELAEVDFDWPFIHLAAFENHFYASFADTIFQIETDGAFDVIYELTEKELEAGYIYGIRIEDDYLYYRLYTSYDANTFAEEKRINLSANHSHVHDWGEGKVTKAASCTEDGVRTYTCSGCGKTKSESIKAIGHTKVKDPAVNATCTEPGLTEGSHCYVCGEVIKNQEEIPVLGHDWNQGVVTKRPTAEEEGELTFTCKRCDVTRTMKSHGVIKSSGTWGNNIFWMLDEHGLLSISGEGDMEKFCTNDNHAWRTVRKSIKEVKIETGITNIGQMAFDECTNLESITIPESVTKIELAAFQQCLSLKSISIPDSVTTIESYAFTSCHSLSEINIPKGITSISDSVLAQCIGLEKIIIPEGITSIGNQAFYACMSLKSIVIPDSVKSIGDKAFNYCRNLENVTIKGSNVTIGRWVFNDTNSYFKIYCPAKSNVVTYAKNNKLRYVLIPVWIRLAGNGRYDTMSEIVKIGFTKTGGTVVVATGTGFKDALAAAGIAGLHDAPVILTDGKNLSFQAQQQLKRLKPSRIYIAGGEVAVSKIVFNSIKTLTGVQPKRCFGQTSAGTSAALAATGSGWSDTAIIATNKTFKDALSAAPLSYSLHMPILLADNGKSLNADVLNALKKCGIKKVIIVGGKLAVTENVEQQLVKNGIAKKNIIRLAGYTAVDTSASIAEYGLKHGMTINGMGVATSQNYPDALAGAALCGHNNSVLVLADDKATKNTSFPKNYKADFDKGYVFGGTVAVSDKVFKALQDAVK